MKLTKDTIIEGKIIKSGSIIELSIEDNTIKEKLTNTTIEANIAKIIISDLQNNTNKFQKLINAVPPYSELGDSMIDLETKVSDRYYKVYNNFWNNQASNDYVNNAKEGEIEASILNTTLSSLGLIK